MHTVDSATFAAVIRQLCRVVVALLVLVVFERSEQQQGCWSCCQELQVHLAAQLFAWCALPIVTLLLPTYG